MSEPADTPIKLWAVVCNGVITPEGLPAFLTKDGNKTYPVPVFFHEDKEVAARKARTLASRISKVRFYDGPGMTPSTPIFGVVEVTFPAKRTMSPERIAKMQAGRNKSTPAKQNPPAVAGKVPSK